MRLTGQEYAQLVLKVLDRDKWRCRRCSSLEHLQVHHIIKRSEVRIDRSWNLCTLCNECHDLVERHIVDVIWPGDQPNADLSQPDPLAIVFRWR